MADNRNYEAMLVFSLKNGEESTRVMKFKELVENNGVEV